MRLTDFKFLIRLSAGTAVDRSARLRIGCVNAVVMPVWGSVEDRRCCNVERVRNGALVLRLEQASMHALDVPHSTEAGSLGVGAELAGTELVHQPSLHFWPVIRSYM